MCNLTAQSCEVCHRFYNPQTPVWESWTWVTMTCRIQEWSCSLMDWRGTVSWRCWGKLFSIKWLTTTISLRVKHDTVFIETQESLRVTQFAVNATSHKLHFMQALWVWVNMDKRGFENAKCTKHLPKSVMRIMNMLKQQEALTFPMGLQNIISYFMFYTL